MPITEIILKNLSLSPGIYKMLDKEKKVIYVGKAKSLKKRVQSYFRKDYQHSTRTRKLIENTEDLEFIETDTELEALILENNLIKELRPKYNILMKDDKSYVYIKVDLSEDFPKIRVVRAREVELERQQASGNKGQKALYFGPKLASNKVYETLRLLKKLFPFRDSQWNIEWKGVAGRQELVITPKKDVEITNKIPEIVQEIVNFLNGKNEDLEKQLREEMMQAAAEKKFEKAARIRDKLSALQAMTERQKITDPQRKDTDVINFTTDLGRVFFNVFMIREGKLINQENFVLDALELSPQEVTIDLAETLESFITQYYTKAGEIPSEILMPERLENSSAVEKLLTGLRGPTVHLLTPQRGEKNKLLELSLKNAVSFSKQHRLKWLAQQSGKEALTRLAQAINLKENKLARIEGYDISHLGGTETVGSMVVFENGIPKSAHYRHFKMRTVVGKPDDYRSMEEVLMRRLKYIKKKSSDQRVRKARKKDAEIIKKWGAQLRGKELIEKPDLEHFFLLEKEKKPIGMARLIEIKSGIFMIEAVYILPEHRGENLSYEFMEKILKTVKNKKARFYISVEDHLLNHWLEFGFEHIHSVPAEVEERNAFTVLALYRMKKKADDPSFTSVPDLIVIDGGKGQLQSAINALKKLNLDLPVISLAKRLEEIFIPGQKESIVLEQRDEALKLLQRIRDESHRFAITFQRDLHRKNQFM